MKMLDKELIKKEIDKLPEDILAEVFNFIQFLENKRERDLLVKSSQRLSTTSFQRIWDNEEDAVYDTV
jgi:DNA replication initiation complex subunit (GINS family)